MIIEQIKQIKERVGILLEKHPELRDNDYKLISTMWWTQIKDLSQYTAFEILDAHAQGKLVCSESIRRCRALLQKEHPELRGKNYKKRKEDGKDFSKEINEV
jgi:hypothetical protein